MLKELDIKTVNSFLKICKKEIKKKNCYFVSYRLLNINGKQISAKQALINLGITKKEQIWNYIYELSSLECIKIDRDKDYKRDTNSEIYVFKKIINSKEVYIKLTLNELGIICISFHENSRRYV